MGYVVRALAGALAAAVPGLAVWRYLPDLPQSLAACIVLGVYALSYFAITRRLGLNELDSWLGALRRRGRKNRERGDE